MTTSRRTAAAVLTAACLLPLGLQVPATASTAQVSVTDFRFTPASVSTGQGGAVTWTFHGMHTTTSDQGFWNSGTRMTGTFTTSFADAGTFGYHCTIHSFMTGKVTVPLRASGSPSTGWRISWTSRTTTPANRSYDVQVKKPGAIRFTAYRSGVRTRSASFDPSRVGTYVFRSRTHNGANGTSGWSPALSLRIS